ncbi:ribbon-helix-helix protein, CopG family [Rhizobium sp. CRIBSB]|nr:ribbon-helix-helix protein, CopG family [Rhizobium sp. CRIBSB]
MLALSLPKDLDARLEDLARMTGQSKAALVEEAIVSLLDDLEDAQVASDRLAALERGESGTVSLESLMKRHGLAD